MDTEREVVDQEIKDESVSIFSPEAYRASLNLLTRGELIEECFKQYQLSGEMLSKYRIYWQKSEDYRKQRDDERLEARRWRRIAMYAQGGLQFVIEHLTAIQVIARLSEGYTHNAMVIVRRLVNNGAQRAIDRANEELDKVHEAAHTAPEELDDIPF